MCQQKTGSTTNAHNSLFAPLPFIDEKTLGSNLLSIKIYHP